MSEETTRINDNTPSEATASEGGSSLSAPAREVQAYDVIGECIVAISAKHQLAGTTDLKVHPKLGALANDLENLLGALQKDSKWSEIQQIQGAKDVYYYSNKNMVENYAQIASLVRDDDLPRTVVEMVRKNAKLFPSPTAEDYFYKHPYRYTESMMRATRSNIRRNPDYEDIIFFSVKNMDGEDVPYISSTLHLSANYAEVLARDNENQEP